MGRAMGRNLRGATRAASVIAWLLVGLSCAGAARAAEAGVEAPATPPALITAGPAEPDERAGATRGRSEGAEGFRDEISAEGPLRYGNQVAIFGGATIIDGTSYATAGIDVEHRFGASWGLGILADWVVGGEEGREFIIAPAVFFHPIDRVRIDLAPGVQRLSKEHVNEFVFRVGIDYDFEFGDHWVAAPNVNVDFVADDFIPVVGAEVGYLF